MHNKKTRLKEYDSYIRHLEEKLSESYRHLGIINRQVSILLTLNKKRPEDGTGLCRFITNSAINVSKANTAVLFRYDANQKEFHLLSVSGETDKKKSPLSLRLREDEHEIFGLVVKKKALSQGKIDKNDPTGSLRKFFCRHYVIFPLIIRKKIRGILFLGFKSKECLSSQELEFFEAFATQSSFVLEKAKAWK